MASIESLLLGASTDDDKARQLADALRGQKRAADLFSMSTLGPVSDAAQEEVGNVLTAAKRGGALRQEAMRDAATQAQRDQTQANWERDFAYKQKKDAADRVLKLATQGKGGKTAYDNMTAGAKNKYTAAKLISEGFPALIERARNLPGAFGLTASPATMLPDWTPNIIAKPAKALQNSMLTSDERQIQNDVFKNAYDIIHELAGATLAAGEEDKISKFAPMPEDSVEVILDKLESAYAEANRTMGVMEGLAGGTPATVTDTTTTQETVSGRPPGVGADWTHQTDANGNTAWVSPNGVDFVED